MQPIKDPKGGLTARGRRHFKKTEGADLKPARAWGEPAPTNRQAASRLAAKGRNLLKKYKLRKA